MTELKRKLKIIAILLLVTICSSAQYYNAGQEKTGIKWRTISSMHFNVIYPEYFEEEAMNVVHLMEKSYEYTSLSLNHFPKNTSVIIHPNTSLSNGFMSWAPKRIEMYAAPNQGIYSQDWMEQLAIHEFRHFVQFSKIQEEMPLWLKILFGEQITAVFSGLWLPSWILEGDAVATETALSTSGRGRKPSFIQQTKALLVEKDAYGYDKSYMGSYKDFVPNYYHMGYYLVAGARELADTLVWDNVFHRIAKHPLRPSSLNHALKKELGLKKMQLYDTIYNIMGQKWREEYAHSVFPKEEQLSPKNSNIFTNYLYPNERSNGNVIAYRTALDKTNGFVEITPDGKENNLFKTGSIFEESATSQNDQLAWCEFAYSTRWEHQRGTWLRIFDINSKEQTDYRYKTKLFAPSFSSDNKKIVLVEVDNQYKFHLVFIDALTGKILQKVETPDNHFFITPTWYNNDQNIVTVALKGNQRSLMTYSFQNGTFETIKEPSQEEFIRPQIKGDTVFYISGNSGTNQVVASILKSGKTYQITKVPFGVGQYNINGNRLIFNNYTSDGYTICRKEIKLSTEITSENETSPYLFAETISKQEKGVIPFDQSDSIYYKSKRYSKIGHALNFHSWAPLCIDPYNQSVTSGISVMSQNELSTTEVTAKYEYDIDKKTGIYGIDLKYKGLYPIFNFEINTGRQKSSYYEIQSYIDKKQQVTKNDTILIPYSWNQTNGNLSMTIPMNFSKGKWSKHFESSIGYTFSKYTANSSKPSNFSEGTMHYAYTTLYYHQILQKSSQDLLPNFGVIMNMQGVKSLSGIKSYGNAMAASGILYLPGIMPNHGFKAYMGYQKKYAADYIFSDLIRNPRGYIRASNKNMLSVNFDYMLPLCLPDWSLGGLLYIRRIKASLFYDWSKAENIAMYYDLREFSFIRSSVGTELSADVNMLRFAAPVELGGRFSYLINDKSWGAGFIFNINFKF